MLRPKKKINRKEINRDPFLETVDQVQANFEDNKSKYIQIGIVILALLVGYNIYSSGSQKKNIKASSSLGDAMLTLDMNDPITAKFQFETVVNEYKNTSSGSLSEYFLGKMSYDNDEIESALRYLESYLKTNPDGFMASSASMILSDLAAENQDYESAIKIIESSIKNSYHKKDLRQLRLRKAEYHLMNGQKDQAKTIVLELLEEQDLTSWHKQIAQEIMGKILS